MGGCRKKKKFKRDQVPNRRTVADIGRTRVAHHGANRRKTALLGPTSTIKQAYLMVHSSLLYMHSHCHQMITQQQPKGPQGPSEVTLKLIFFSQPNPA